MRSVFVLVALPLLLLLIVDGSLPLLPAISVKAFPAVVTSSLASTVPHIKNATQPINNLTTDDTPVAAGEVTEYPVFISVTEETQPSPETLESEVITETYMIIEDQEIDDDEDVSSSDSSTVSPVRSTTPMPSPKSSPEQEEVLRELKKLWDLSEGMSDTEDDALKNSLSSIVHLAYARVYIEPDETLLKLKYLLQQLQERILLGTNSNLGDDESRSTTDTESESSSSLHSTTATSSSYPTATTSSPTSLMTATTASSESNDTSGKSRSRRKRSFYDGYDDEVEAIFFANVNSNENSVIPEEKDNYLLQQPQNHGTKHDRFKLNLTNSNVISHAIQIKNASINNTKKEDPNSLDRTLLSIGSVSSSSSVISMPTTTPSAVVQKIIHINDRQKPMPSFYLTPGRIKELKSRVTSSTTTATTSTLSPISIIIEDELENEVNLLQQQQHVDNYDIHISSSDTLVPLTTATPLNSSFHKKPLKGDKNKIVISPSSTTTTESPFTAEDIALALFQLLRPDTFEDDESDAEKVTVQPHPTPSSILYQVGSLSSVLNFTIKGNNVSTSTTTTKAPIKLTTTKTKVPVTTMASTKLNTTLSFLKLKEKYTIKNKNNASILLPPPFLSDLGFTTSTMSSSSTSSSTERQYSPQSNDIYDYTDVHLDQKPSATVDQTSISNIVHGTQEGVQQMVNALARLSVGAKMVLLFSVSISILSIGFGIYALGPPLAGVGVLGIVIPIGLLLLFETSASSAGKRKLTTRQQQQILIDKLQSEEFSKIFDMIFDAVVKYSHS